jgi:hypothetical protein
MGRKKAAECKRRETKGRKKAWADMYRNETGLDKGGLPAARVVLLWS